MPIAEDISRLYGELSEENQRRVREYIEYLQWRESRSEPRQGWSFDFIEHFSGAERRAERDPAGLEVKIADATCGGDKRVALWEHPPLSGAARVGYVVAIPGHLRDLRLKFAIGIRDGAELPPDRYVAFRVMVNDWKLWSAVKNSHRWDDYEVALPELSSDVVRIEFITDGLGEHRWTWAVWGEPRLTGEQSP